MLLPGLGTCWSLMLIKLSGSIRYCLLQSSSVLVRLLCTGPQSIIQNDSCLHLQKWSKQRKLVICDHQYNMNPIQWHFWDLKSLCRIVLGFVTMQLHCKYIELCISARPTVAFTSPLFGMYTNYTSWWQRNMCEQLSQVVMWIRRARSWNCDLCCTLA